MGNRLRNRTGTTSRSSDDGVGGGSPTPPECLTGGLPIPRRVPIAGCASPPDRETFGRADGGLGDPPNRVCRPSPEYPARCLPRRNRRVTFDVRAFSMRPTDSGADWPRPSRTIDLGP